MYNNTYIIYCIKIYNLVMTKLYKNGENKSQYGDKNYDKKEQKVSV